MELTLESLSRALNTPLLDHEGNAVLVTPHGYRWSCGKGHGGTASVDDRALLQAYHDQTYPHCKGTV